MAKYGIPYMGSKGSICDKLIEIFPSATNFYDLFGGGFAVTHAMLVNRSSDFKSFHYNEIKSDVVDLVSRAIAGEFSYSKFLPEWVSREDFLRLKDSNAYVRLCWSFGNNQRDYLFGKTIEPYKKSMHNAVVFNNFDSLAEEVLGFNSFDTSLSVKDRRLFLRRKIDHYRKTKLPDCLVPFLSKKQQEKFSIINGSIQLQLLQQLERLQQLQQLEQVERLQQLEQLKQLQQLQQVERLDQLQRLERLKRLKLTSKSYDEVEIRPDSVIYCDPPYLGTTDYGNEFDHEKFFNWCANQSSPVFISEYKINDSRFKEIFNIRKISRLDNSSETKNFKTEKVYGNAAAIKLIRRT